MKVNWDNLLWGLFTVTLAVIILPQPYPLVFAACLGFFGPPAFETKE